jgi:hypothetical protein
MRQDEALKSPEMLQISLLDDYSFHYLGLTLASLLVAALSNHLLVLFRISHFFTSNKSSCSKAQQNLQMMMEEYEWPMFGQVLNRMGRFGNFCFLELSVLATLLALVFLPIVVQTAKVSS